MFLVCYKPLQIESSSLMGMRTFMSWDPHRSSARRTSGKFSAGYSAAISLAILSAAFSSLHSVDENPERRWST